VRDGGCIAAGCDRPAPWTDAHHLTHWLAGGATSLENLVLLCRTHHRAVHEGGWRLHHTSGRRTLAPSARHLIPAAAT
jgi:HNH endonuclease